MRVLAIDPGCELTAYVVLADGVPTSKAKVRNSELLEALPTFADHVDQCVIEMVASYGMAVGREVFETVVFIGRLMERWERATGSPMHRLYRRDVKIAICHHPRATDSNIRTEIIDRFGGKERGIGSKREPGPLFGFKADTWQALALAITFADARAAQTPVVEVPPAIPADVPTEAAGPSAANQGGN